MTCEQVDAPIRPGFGYTIELEFDRPILRMDAVFVAHVRRRISAPDILFSLSSEGGEIQASSHSKIVVQVPAEKTALLSPHSVWVDFVERGSVDHCLCPPVEIPVRLTVTRGLS